MSRYPIRTERGHAILLGSLLRTARTDARRSLEQTAELLGISPEDYSRLESGERCVSTPELHRLCALNGLRFELAARFLGPRDT
jgi:transcriptional regulator with XRE-family HTH domain